MAKEMLDIIRRAETEAYNREKMAKNSADAAVKRANAEAVRTVENAVASAKEKVKELEDSTREECAVRSGQSKKASDAECERLSALADKNRERVIGLIKNCITEI